MKIIEYKGVKINIDPDLPVDVTIDDNGITIKSKGKLPWTPAKPDVPKKVEHIPHIPLPKIEPDKHPWPMPKYWWNGR